MGVLTVIFLGCAALLSASSSADSNQTQTEAVDQENSLLRILAAAVDNKKDQKDVPERVEDINCIALTNTGKGEDALDIPEQSDDGLTKRQGCEGHQKEEQWGSSDHDNCICQAPDRLCYHVDCLPGSEIVRDSDGIWSCDVTSYKRDITGSAVAMHERIKRIASVAAVGIGLGIFNAVSGIVGHIRREMSAASTSAKLNEIQGLIRELDRKVDELTRSVSDLKLGQEYLQQVILYGRDEKRLRNMLDTHAEMQIRNGQYVLPGHNIQAWADSVLSYRSDGVDQVLYNLLDMVKPHSGVFGGKSLMEICHLRLIDRDNLEKYTEKMQQKAAQVYGLIGGGYAVWITALRIKDRASEIPAKTREMKSELSTVVTSLLKYTKPKNWRADLRCGPGYPADNGKPAKCPPDSKFPCCSLYNWCGNTADHCGCAGCVVYRAPQGKAWRDDLRCGAGYPAPNGQPAKCDPAGRFPCCSPGKWCGNTAAHCTCSGCVNYFFWGL